MDKTKLSLKRLLIIDDEAYVEKIKNMFGRRGIEAFWAETGLRGVEYFKSLKPDAVLLDFHLPDINGLDVFKKLIKANPNLNVYFISASPTPEIQLEAKRLGAKGFFMKPVNLMSVVSALLPHFE